MLGLALSKQHKLVQIMEFMVRIMCLLKLQIKLKGKTNRQLTFSLRLILSHQYHEIHSSKEKLPDSIFPSIVIQYAKRNFNYLQVHIYTEMYSGIFFLDIENSQESPISSNNVYDFLWECLYCGRGK